MKLSYAGRRQEAAAEIAVALQLDPESFEVNLRAGSIGYGLHRLEEVARYWEKAATLAETDLTAPLLLINFYTAQGDKKGARRIASVALERAEKALARDRSNGSALETGAGALAALGETERAKDWMKRGLLIDPDNLAMRYSFARALATSLSDPEAALEMLGPVLEKGAGRLLKGIPTDPDLAGLRDDPRFQALYAAARARLAGGGADEIAAP